jgi:hypothetical protein
MTALGTILLTLEQLWQKFAENVSRHACMFALAATQAMVCLVVDPSSKSSSTFCQKRYPSPSKRSGLSRVRPRRFWGTRGSCLEFCVGSADSGQSAKKHFALFGDNDVTVCAIQFHLREGSYTCSKKPGSSQLLHWWALRPASTMTPNAAWRVLPAVQSLRMRLAAMLRWAQSWAVAPAYSATTWACATKTGSARFAARVRRPIRTIWACAPVVLFVLPTAGQRPVPLT